MQLSGKKAIITGAAQGIGLAIAQRYVAEGAEVLLSDINEPLLAKEARALDMPYFVADVSIKKQVDALMAEAMERLGQLDIMVSNAGIINKPASFLDFDEAVFDHVMAVNLKSQFLCGQAAARIMVDRGTKGVIINMSSVNARLAIPAMTPYVVSKAGSTQLTNVMALSLAEYGIRVVAIGPGTIVTELAKDGALSNEKARRNVLLRTPLRRTGEPSEVAGVAVFLAGDDASYLTGQTIYLDGGRLGLNYMVDLPEP